MSTADRDKAAESRTFAFSAVVSTLLHLALVAILLFTVQRQRGDVAAKPKPHMQVLYVIQAGPATPAVVKPPPPPVTKPEVSHDPLPFTSTAEAAPPTPAKTKPEPVKKPPVEVPKTPQKPVTPPPAPPQPAAAKESPAEAAADGERGLMNHIRARWLRPPRLNPLLHCVVKIEIDASGQISRVTMVRSSGNADFDDSIIRAIYKSDPLPVTGGPQVGPVLMLTFGGDFLS